MAMSEKNVPARWADEPYPLITTPYTYKDLKSHSCVLAASDMASIHNLIIRGLNSIVLQAPHIPTADQDGYVEQDVLDFLKYMEFWSNTLEHHHEVEETVLFPRWEELLNCPGLLTSAEEQHEAFHAGLVKFGKEAKRLQKVPKEYRWADLKAIVDDFAEALVFHLNEEIELFLSFERLDSDLVLKAWKEAENYAKTHGGIAALHDFMPMCLVNSDRTYEGSNTFPPLPKPLTWAINLYFSRTYANVWRFAPCDIHSRPRPLPFLPENRVKA